MEYRFLKDDELNSLLAARVRELEINHYQLCLEEAEEPGRSPVRTRAITDLERRISDYHTGLTRGEKMGGDTPERESGGVVEP